MYREQTTWDKECFCVPVAGIEGDIYATTDINGSCKAGPFISWLLTQTDSKGKPYLRSVERANSCTYFFTTTYAQRRETYAWINNIDDVMNKTFSLDLLMEVCKSEMACVRRANKSRYPVQTPVDDAYKQLPELMIGNPQEFLSLDASKEELAQRLGPAVSTWNRSPSIAYNGGQPPPAPPLFRNPQKRRVGWRPSKHRQP